MEVDTSDTVPGVPLSPRDVAVRRDAGEATTIATVEPAGPELGVTGASA